MKDHQENTLSMYRVVEKLLEDNDIIWNGVPAMVTAKGALSNKIIAVTTAAGQQQAVITGIATDKKVLKLALVDIIYPIAKNLVALAASINNNQLLEASNFSHSDLLRMRDDLLTQRAQTIKNNANDNLLPLAPYGITAPVLATVQTAIDSYNLKVPATGSAKSAKRATTTTVRNLIKETNNLLKFQVDSIMTQFKATNLEFFNAYHNAREIKDLGATHTKIFVTVKDADGQPLMNATFSLLQNGLVIYSGTTDSNGKLTIAKIKPGTYTLKTQKNNYTTKTEAGVGFKAGKKIKRTVSLASGAVTPPANNTAIRESDIAPAETKNIDLTGINGTPITTITIETDVPIRVYASATINGAPGLIFQDVLPPAPFIKLASDFVLQLGLNDTNRFLNVLCTGPSAGHFKFTFSNLE